MIIYYTDINFNNLSKINYLLKSEFFFDFSMNSSTVLNKKYVLDKQMQTLLITKDNINEIKPNENK